MIEKRIENLSFNPATYLLPKEEYPKHPAWHINYWYPNPYYGKKNEYVKNGDWYVNDKLSHIRIHKDCFKYDQNSMAIASFTYDESENFYNIEFIGDRPLQLTSEEKEIFWELLKYGNEQLNNKKDED